MAGWFSVNVADAPAFKHQLAGTFVPFESREERFTDYGINIHVLQPGEPNAKYHSESVQEDFLVLAGECIGIIDGAEHRFRAWDFVHFPPGHAHVFVGAGDGPCAILMVGTRGEHATVHYAVSELAARYRASVDEPTDDSRTAYADWPTGHEETRLDWPPSGRGTSS
jgi:uncharacterized cupin superfamily protein